MVLASFLTSTWPIAIAGFVLVAVLGFVVGERTPRRRGVCRIVLSKTGDQCEFLALTGPRVITRSDPFPTGDEEAGHAAHDILMARLAAEGLHPAPWYEARLATV